MLKIKIGFLIRFIGCDFSEKDFCKMANKIKEKQESI